MRQSSDNQSEAIIKIVIFVVLLIVAGFFAFLIPILVITLVTILSFALIDDKKFATLISILGVTYVSSIFTLIIFYSEPSRIITQLDAAMSIISWGSVATYLDLFVNIWIDSQGIWLQWVFFSIGSVAIIFAIIGGANQNTL